MTAATLNPSLHDQISLRFTRKRRLAFAIPLIILAYLTYAFFAFDLPGLAARARMDNAVILLSDFWSHKTHVTRDNRREGGKVVLTAPQPLPEWINASDTKVSVTAEAGRFSYSRSKVETFKYQAGWE